MPRDLAVCIFNQCSSVEDAYYIPYSPRMKFGNRKMVIILPMRRWDVGGVSLMKKWCAFYILLHTKDTCQGCLLYSTQSIGAQRGRDDNNLADEEMGCRGSLTDEEMVRLLYTKDTCQ